MKAPPIVALFVLLGLYGHGLPALEAAPPSSLAPVTLAPNVTLELAAAGSGGGEFFVTPQPISKAQFQAFTSETNYRTEAERGTSGGFGYDPATGKTVQRAGYSWRNPGFDQAPDAPVVGVTRDDARAFLAWASRKAGRTLTLPTVRNWELAVAAYSPARPAGPGTSVREWTSEMVPETPGQPPRAILRGASWLQDAAKPDPTKLSHAASPGSRQPDVGFRACTQGAAGPGASAAPAATGSPVSSVKNEPAATLVPVATATVAQAAPDSPVPTPGAAPSEPGSSIRFIAIVILALVVIVPILIVVLVVRAILKAVAKSRNPPDPQRTGTPTPNSRPTAVVVSGGIRVRASVPEGTPLRVVWSGGPEGGLTVPYRPGPQGMFIPAEGIVRDPHASLVAAEGIVPEAVVTPVADGFRVSGALSNGVTVYASWVDAAGAEQSGSARYDATTGYAAFLTPRPPVKVAVSLRRPPAARTLPANPPQGFKRMSVGSYGASPAGTVHSYQNNDAFWTGFWLSDVLSPPPLPGSPVQNTYGSSMFDDNPGYGSRSSSLFGRSEPPAYH